MPVQLQMPPSFKDTTMLDLGTTLLQRDFILCNRTCRDRVSNEASFGGKEG